MNVDEFNYEFGFAEEVYYINFDSFQSNYGRLLLFTWNFF